MFEPGDLLVERRHDFLADIVRIFEVDSLATEPSEDHAVVNPGELFPGSPADRFPQAFQQTQSRRVFHRKSLIDHHIVGRKFSVFNGLCRRPDVMRKKTGKSGEAA